MSNVSGSEPIITRCTFGRNTATDGGAGGFASLNSNPSITDSVFCENIPFHLSGDYVDGGGNIFDDVCSAGVDDPPDEPDYDFPPDTGATHLILVTHGWKTSQARFDNFWVPLAVEIQSAIVAKGNWLVRPYDWTADSCRFLGAGCALNNAQTHGTALGSELASRGYEYVHLIAHSAGAALISAAAWWLELYSPDTVVHTTFLDAYAGLFSSPWNSHEEFYGGHSDWSDHYYSEEGIPGFNCGLTTGPFTNLILPHCYNGDVSLLDPDYDPNCRSSHGWPATFYRGSIDDADCKAFDAYAGFGYSFEYLADFDLWEGITAALPLGVYTNVFPCPDGVSAAVPSGEEELEFETRFNDPINFDTAPYVTGGGEDAILVNTEGFVATADLGPAAWITISIEVTKPVNLVEFEAQYTSEAGAQGLLTVYADDEEIGFVDEEYAVPGFGPYRLQFEEFDPGPHSITFRLDAFADTHSTVQVSDVATGWAGFVEAANLCPWDLDGDGNVGVTDLVLLLGDFGSCDGSPADFDGDGCVSIMDLLTLLFNFGPCPDGLCPWDVNGDETVDLTDLFQVLTNLGPCDGCPEDVNGDGVVDFEDVIAVLTHFGPCP